MFKSITRIEKTKPRRYKNRERRTRMRSGRGLGFESCEARLLLAASDWVISENYIAVEDVESSPADGLSGDVVEITIGDLNWGPIQIPGDTYQATLPLDPAKNYAIYVDYDVSTYDVLESSRLFIGPDWRFGGTMAPVLESTAGMLAISMNGESSFSVGMQSYGPYDFFVSFGTVTVRVEERQPEQSHDTACEAETPFGGIAPEPTAGNHRGEGALTLAVTGESQLIYNSADNPHPVLTGKYLVPDEGSASDVPDEVHATLTINGNQVGNPVIYDVSSLQTGDSFTMSMQADLSGTNGFFDYQIDMQGYRNGTRMGGQFEQTVSGNYGVQNRSDSYFGNRFWLQELDELDVQSTGVALLTDSSDAVWFEKATSDPFDGTYNSPPGVFSTLEQQQDGSFTLTDHFGFVREFDISGLLQKRIDPNGNETQYVYFDANSDFQAREIERIIDPFQRETLFNYDAFGMVISVIDFAGRETTMTYENGRLATLLEPDPDAGGPITRPETVLSYAANGRLANIRDARSATNSLAYDGFGLVSGGVNADGSSWSLSPVLSVLLIDPTTTVGTLVALPDSERFAEHVDSRGYATQTTTDAFGLLTSLTDALNNHYITNRDLDGRVTSIVEPDPDGGGPLEALVTQFEYAFCTNISQMTFADGSTSSWTYNAISQPLSYVDELGRTTLFEYDTTDFNLTKRTQVMGANDLADPRPAGDPDDIVYRYTYTGTGNVLPAGLVLSETDPLGRETRFAYETDVAAHDFGWLKEVTSAAGTDVAASVRYEYDPAGNVTAFVDELGHRTEYTYDDLDRLVTLRDPGGR